MYAPRVGCHRSHGLTVAVCSAGKIDWLCEALVWMMMDLFVLSQIKVVNFRMTG